jgi:uncharacterized protein YqeY
MLNLQQIESDLTIAMKAKNQIAVDTLRGLKVRLQNEKTAAGRPEQSEGSLPGKKELTESEIIALVKSEIKRRKEAAESFTSGGRAEMAEKELAEAKILENYMPAQMSEPELSKIIDEVIAGNNFTAADFGKAMGALKSKVGQSADGGLMARLLKEKLK